MPKKMTAKEKEKERRDEERRRILGPGMGGRAAEALMGRRRRMRARLGRE